MELGIAERKGFFLHFNSVESLNLFAKLYAQQRWACVCLARGVWLKRKSSKLVLLAVFQLLSKRLHRLAATLQRQKRPLH